MAQTSSRPHLDGVPIIDEDLLLVDVEVHGGDDGEVGRGPLVEVDDELEGEVGQLLADGGEHEGAVGGEAEEGAVEGAEDAAARCQAEGAAGAEAAADAVARGALLVRFAVPRVALDQVPSEAAAPPRAVPVPEELLGLKDKRVTPGEGQGPLPDPPWMLSPVLFSSATQSRKSGDDTLNACALLLKSLLPASRRTLHVSTAMVTSSALCPAL